MPGLLVGLFAGALADRVAPVTMLVVMEFGQMGLAFVLATLVGLQVVQIWQMAAILALARICVTFELPSRQVFFYELVGPEILSNAIALNSGLFNATRVLGPALAGVCLSTLGATGCFALNGLSYVAAIAAILSIRLPKRLRPMHAEGFEFKEILGGLSYLRTDRRISAQFTLVAFFGVVGMGYDAMIAAYAQRVVRDRRRGIQHAAGLQRDRGDGGGVGHRHVEWRPPQGTIDNRGHGPVLLLSRRGGRICRLLRGRAGPARPGCRWRPSVCWARAFGAVLFYSSSMMVIQLAVPDRLRGRVMGIWMIVFSGSVPLGALWTGRAAQSWGVAPVMGLSAALCVTAALFVWASGVLTPPEVQPPPIFTRPRRRLRLKGS